MIDYIALKLLTLSPCVVVSSGNSRVYSHYVGLWDTDKASTLCVNTRVLLCLVLRLHSIAFLLYDRKREPRDVCGCFTFALLQTSGQEPELSS